MAITSLDPVSALIVIDLQNGVVSYPTAHPISEVIAKSVALVDAFRAANLPIVLVNVDGVAPGRSEQSRPPGSFPDGWDQLIPELNRQSSDHIVTKRTWGAFTATDLHEYLKGRGVTQVVIVGVATSIGVESTARQAHELGYNVTLPLDAMTDMTAECHANSAARIFPRLGETGSSADVLSVLGNR